MILALVLACCIDSPAWTNPREGHVIVLSLDHGLNMADFQHLEQGVTYELRNPDGTPNGTVCQGPGCAGEAPLDAWGLGDSTASTTVTVNDVAIEADPQ